MDKLEAKRARLQQAWGEARRLAAAGQVNQALQIFEKIATAAPREPLVWLELGRLHLQALQLPLAIADFERYLALAGEGPEVLAQLGRAKYMQGRTGEALAHFQDVLARWPGYPAVYYDYSGVRRFDAETGPELIGKIEKLIAKQDTSPKDRKFLHFAAGKINQDIERWSEAFGHYQKGNALHEEAYDPSAIGKLAQDIRRVFTPSAMKGLARPGDAGRRHIFIVGMPRSGSSLIEQLLINHATADAGSAGETAALWQVLADFGGPGDFPANMAGLTAERRAQAGQAYGQLVGTITGKKARVVDKNLFNFTRLGALKAILPGARIIHCRRDALETCWSCYSTLFETGIGFAYDMETLAGYYTGYADIMAHWREIGIEMLEFDYEQMIAEPEAAVTRLHEFAGLEPDLTVLDARQRTGPVTTASKWQARQPLYRTALGRAQQYGDLLDPLRVALERG